MDIGNIVSFYNKPGLLFIIEEVDQFPTAVKRFVKLRCLNKEHLDYTPGYESTYYNTANLVLVSETTVVEFFMSAEKCDKNGGVGVV